jgi:hypothetical protein
MSMRMSISQAAMVVLAGCGVTATTEYPATDQEVLAALGSTTGEPTKPLVVNCPDPKTDCTHSNGTGIYFEEGGNAGFDEPLANVAMMMITTFTNDPLGGVTVRGRYHDTSSGLWLLADGIINSAEYNGVSGLQVVKVSEDQTIPTDLTIPTWMLADPNNNKIPVTDTALLSLKLHVTFQVSKGTGAPMQVLLAFDDAKEIPDTDPHGNTFQGHPFLHAYNLLWSVDDGQSMAQYCYRGPKAAKIAPPGKDQVVFQQGISVDPVNGTVEVDSNVVTMSCAFGSVAKAYNFGYTYVEPNNAFPFLYASAIHMKRAAYCGNWNYYTVDGIPIGISDTFGINGPPQDFVLEAQWSPKGATCVNTLNLRSPNAPHPQSPFQNKCPGSPGSPGKVLTDCSSSPEPAPLESYTNPKNQGPPGS